MENIRGTLLLRFSRNTYIIRYNVTVLCSGGFHINGMSREEIKEVLEMARLIAEEI